MKHDVHEVNRRGGERFPPRNAGASLKPPLARDARREHGAVFPRVMRGPH